MPESPPQRGFQGAVSSLPLVDVIQLQAGNGFSGLISVSSSGRVGRLYFVDGAIVHAESPEGVVGEEAVYAIVGWPGGTFNLHPNTATLERTIHKSVAHLLIEAHQFIDERRHRPPPRPSAPASRPNLVDTVRAVPGVADVVRFGMDGVPQGDASPEAETLAARGLYLAMTHGAAVSAAFGLGELNSVSLRSESEPLLLFHSQGNYLCVSIASQATNDEVEARIRALLAHRGAK
jgi:hypothetical protein